MNKHLEQLVKLSTFDKDIVNFDPKIKNEEEKLKVFTQVVTKLTENVEKLYGIIDDAKNKRIKNDIHLKELSSKLEEIAGKHNLAKNEKEVKALQLEEEIAKEQVNFANEEINRLNALSASKTEELDVLKEELATEEESVKELKEAIDANIAALVKGKNSIYEEKSILVSTVDAKVLSFYEKIKRWAHENAVVPIKKQACYGCHMKLSDRDYAEFIASTEIMNCPHCGRIIYKENEPSV
ncbi:MAG: putative nucleic acid-binding Zn-ribbon protein [Arcobacteraceae bacterium]